MRQLLSGLVGLGIVLAVLAGAAYLFPAGARESGLDVWSLPALTVQLEEERLRQEELTARDEAALAQVAARGRVVDDLAAGRLTLREAADAFAALNGAPDYPREAFDGSFPGASDEERCCQSVLAWARQRLRGRPGGDEVIRRLEAELKEVLAVGRWVNDPRHEGPQCLEPAG
jgi:hypothetical protein